MSNIFETARIALAAQIADATKYSTFHYPQPIPQAMSVQIAPETNYISWTNQKSSQTARMRVRLEIFTPIWDNQGNFAQIEAIAIAVRDAIIDTTQNCGDLTDVRPVSFETGDLLTAYLPVEILVNGS